MIDPSFWQGRNVFITGHTGFKGSWLVLWLNQLGANITGFSLDPPTEPAMFVESSVEAALAKHIYGDIRTADTFSSAMQAARPDIVIHMAAQSLVRDSYSDPVATYSTNVMGTVNMLEAVRGVPSVKAVLNITTDKCYENKEREQGYREEEAMGGHDPYSSSKGCAELVSSAYRRSFLQEAGVALATARSGNVIGGGDWAKDRIVPDAMNAFMNKTALMVRNPIATRPWQHVLEPLAGYLMLCQQLTNQSQEFAEGWNFGPDDKDVRPVSDLADIMVREWGGDACWQLDDGAHPHEARDLKLDCTRAKTRLNWQPVWKLEKALSETVQWYKAWHKGESMRDFTLRQIEAYQKDLLI